MSKSTELIMRRAGAELRELAISRSVGKEYQLYTKAIATMAECAQISAEKSHEAGRYGWWDEESCTLHDLRCMLIKKVNDNDMVAVSVLSAMIHMREAMVEGEDSVEVSPDLKFLLGSRWWTLSKIAKHKNCGFLRARDILTSAVIAGILKEGKDRYGRHQLLVV